MANGIEVAVWRGGMRIAAAIVSGICICSAGACPCAFAFLSTCSWSLGQVLLRLLRSCVGMQSLCARLRRTPLQHIHTHATYFHAFIFLRAQFDELAEPLPSCLIRLCHCSMCFRLNWPNICAGHQSLAGRCTSMLGPWLPAVWFSFFPRVLG